MFFICDSSCVNIPSNSMFICSFPMLIFISSLRIVDSVCGKRNYLTNSDPILLMMSMRPMGYPDSKVRNLRSVQRLRKKKILGNNLKDAPLKAYGRTQGSQFHTIRKLSICCVSTHLTMLTL
ncbi:hypothetical protein QVD17_37238 [Tagetes erecta]|uniref:Uncharacterized protein n=1 Tax=Tagetes erecta TaxID=13708 RepID=A0AAD8JW50_TARER|nr:hypothetical protein QVD17_37238 [Tagetes erecta]